jgi:dipeptidyl aminopeptidase/acylaminoacyl peptidase
MAKEQLCTDPRFASVRRRLALPVIWLIVGFRYSANAQQQEQAPLPIKDAISAKDFAYQAPLASSPNGLWIAYTLQQQQRREPVGPSKHFSQTGVPRELEDSEVWLTNVDTGRSKKLTAGGRSAWSPSWSPDGRLLAFYSDQGGRTQLWIWDSVTGESRPPSSAAACPFWGFEVPHWTADGKHILVKLLPQNLTPAETTLVRGVSGEKASSESSGVTARIYGTDTTPTIVGDVLDREFGDLALVDVATGSVDRIVKRVNTHGYWVSPDSAHIAYTRIVPPDPNTQRNLFDVVVVDLPNRRTRVLAPSVDMDRGTGVSWSPDSSLLSFLSGERSLKTSGSRAPGDCYLVPVDTGGVSKATDMPHPDFADRSRAPIWDPSGKYLYLLTHDALWKIEIATRKTVRIPGPAARDLMWIATSSETGQLILVQSKSAIVLARDGATRKEGFYRIDLSSQAANRLTEESQSIGAAAASLYQIVATRDGEHVVYVSEGAQNPRDLWTLDVARQTARRLTAINPTLDRYVFGRSRLLSYKSDDGQALHGALLLPPAYKEEDRYPLIVYVYGGSLLSEHVNQFGFGESGIDNMQLFSTRGYAVLFVDMPLVLGTPMRDIASSVLPAVNKVIDLGIANPDRIGVMGQSYGGYSVLALLVQTQRFRAAIARGAQGDLISTYGLMNPEGYPTLVAWAEYGQGRMGGTPWQFRDRYIDNSPVFFLDRVQTPLLLIQGGSDNTVPPSEAEEIFVGLRRLGKEVIYAKYSGEGHYEGDWSVSNRIDYLQRVLSWFGSHLKTEEPGETDDATKSLVNRRR